MNVSQDNGSETNMSGKLWLAGGLAAGYVLGTRAGRQRYDQISETVRKVKEDPAIANALEVVQNQAGRIYASGRAVLEDKIGTVKAERLSAEREADLVNSTLP
jgi:hypothetical protein